MTWVIFFFCIVLFFSMYASMFFGVSLSAGNKEMPPAGIRMIRIQWDEQYRLPFILMHANLRKNQVAPKVLRFTVIYPYFSIYEIIGISKTYKFVGYSGRQGSMLPLTFQKGLSRQQFHSQSAVASRPVRYPNVVSAGSVL